MHRVGFFWLLGGLVRGVNRPIHDALNLLESLKASAVPLHNLKRKGRRTRHLRDQSVDLLHELTNRRQRSRAHLVLCLAVDVGERVCLHRHPVTRLIRRLQQRDRFLGVFGIRGRQNVRHFHNRLWLEVPLDHLSLQAKRRLHKLRDIELLQLNPCRAKLSLDLLRTRGL